MTLPKTVLITGANGQTAVYLAKRLSEHGCHLLLLYHKRIDRIEPWLKGGNQDIPAEPCDITDCAQTRASIAKLIQRSGLQPDGLIHTAAVRSADAQILSETNPPMWEQVLRSNLLGAYHVLHCVLPFMQAQGKGRIVLFGSSVTQGGLPQGSAYAAAKAGLVNLAKTTAQEYLEAGIIINAVSPGPLDTDLVADYQGNYLQFRRKYFSEYLKAHPQNHLVSMEEVAETVIALLDYEQHITGQEIFLPQEVK